MFAGRASFLAVPPSVRGEQICIMIHESCYFLNTALSSVPCLLFQLSFGSQTVTLVVIVCLLVLVMFENYSFMSIVILLIYFDCCFIRTQ